MPSCFPRFLKSAYPKPPSCKCSWFFPEVHTSVNIGHISAPLYCARVRTRSHRGNFAWCARWWVFDTVSSRAGVRQPEKANIECVGLSWPSSLPACHNIISQPSLHRGAVGKLCMWRQSIWRAFRGDGYHQVYKPRSILKCTNGQNNWRTSNRIGRGRGARV